MSNIMEKIETYFDSVSDEKLTKDLLQAGFTLRCRTHPRYAIKRKPTSDCPACIRLWNAKNNGKLGSVDVGESSPPKVENVDLLFVIRR